jgi:hypothetical protein
MTEQIAPATQTCFGMPGLHRYLGNALVRVRTPLGASSDAGKKESERQSLSASAGRPIVLDHHSGVTQGTTCRLWRR